MLILVSLKMKKKLVFFIIAVSLSLIYFVQAGYTPPSYTNITQTLDNNYTIPNYTNIILTLGKSVDITIFNITLIGKPVITSNSTGSITNELNFTSSSSSESDINPCVQNTNDCQSSSVPIFTFNRTRTTNLKCYMKLNQSLASCMSLFTKNDSSPSSSTIINTTYQNIFNLTGGGQKIWLWVNYTNAAYYDITHPTIWIKCTT